MSGYSVFARHYDVLMKNLDYKRRAAYFDALVRRHSTLGGRGILLDLACGTGSLSVELSRLGYDVIGTDASREMLSAALQKSAENALDILFLNQKMEKLDLYGTVDLTICALDSLNHLHSEKQLDAAFSKVALFSNPGALFIFDMNTVYKHRQILADNAFVFEVDDLFCVWQNLYRDDACHTVDIQLDFFEKRDGKNYARYSESFSERVFEDALVEQYLVKNGMSLVARYHEDSFEVPDETSQRVIYIAMKDV